MLVDKVTEVMEDVENILAVCDATVFGEDHANKFSLARVKILSLYC